MIPDHPPRALAFAFAFALLATGLGSSSAQAQFFDGPGSDFDVTSPAISSIPVVTSTPVVRATRASTWRERRLARRQVRYETMRPTYASGPGITFAPFSDRYYPRTIYAREPSRAIAPQPTVTTVYPR